MTALYQRAMLQLILADNEMLSTEDRMSLVAGAIADLKLAGVVASGDPIFAIYMGGLNQYVFVNNNPVNWIDPFGLCKDKKWWEKLEEGYYYGTGTGQEAMDWYVQQFEETGKWRYALGGGISALWTSETYQKTGWTLATA